MGYGRRVQVYILILMSLLLFAINGRPLLWAEERSPILSPGENLVSLSNLQTSGQLAGAISNVSGIQTATWMGQSYGGYVDPSGNVNIIMAKGTTADGGTFIGKIVINPNTGEQRAVVFENKPVLAAPIQVVYVPTSGGYTSAPVAPAPAAPAPAAPAGCSLDSSGNYTVNFHCDLYGSHYLRQGSLTINNGTIQMNSGSSFAFDRGHSIQLNGANAYILKPATNTRIEKR